MPPEAATTTAADTTAATTTTATTAPPWHNGIEPETLGFWQNKGYDTNDPKALAGALTKQYRELERHMGAPPDQLLRMPKPDAKPDEIAAFWKRLGAPGEAKEYDFSTVKRADGKELDPSIADALRAAALAAHTPKDAATAIATAVANALDAARSAESAVSNAKVAEEKAALAKEWGPNFDFNHLKAMEGARRLGITPEAVKALEGQIGYKGVMEAMRKIGAGTSEDTFVDRGTGGAGQVTTREGAMARKAELFADKAWCKRLNAGDVQAVQEWTSLNVTIDGDARAA